MNGKSLTWTALVAAGGALVSLITFTQLVVEPLKARFELARENGLRELQRLDRRFEELEHRLRDLERGRRDG